MIKTKLRPDLESVASVEDVISLDDSISIDNVMLSPTHYIGKATEIATNVAMDYLPSQVINKTNKAANKGKNADFRGFSINGKYF